jgi:hypothetical protein
MQMIALALIVAAATGLAVWRGVALFKYGFRKRNL